MSDRPARKYIPVRVRRAVLKRQNHRCPCGCETVMAEKGPNTRYDHSPALILRTVNRRRTDYVPPQLDQFYIVARCTGSHQVKTSGRKGHTSAGSDIGRSWKIKRIRGEVKGKPKRAWPKQRMKSRRTKWPKRKIRNG